MKTQVKELKRIARGNLTGNYLELIRAYVFCTVVVSLVEMPFSMMTTKETFSLQNLIYYAAMILISIASVVLTGGQYRMHLAVARAGKAHPGDLFYPVKNHTNRYIFTELMRFGIYVIAMAPFIISLVFAYLYDNWSLYALSLVFALLSLALGLYISLSFDLVYFVLNDKEELSMWGALKYTKNLMKTHKGRFLYLQLSFLGMILLVALSFGTAMFWVQPYMVQTTALFYLDVKGELSAIQERKKAGPSPEPSFFNEYV